MQGGGGVDIEDRQARPRQSAHRGLDIFTGKKYEDLCPTSHNMDIPFVKRTEYQLLNADKDSGEVSLLLEDGNTKDDLNLPCFVAQGEPTEEDTKCQKEILEAFDA